jgi:hypothetical protein
MSDPPESDLPPYPHELVVGMFDDDQAMRRAVEALRRSGFEPDDFDVLHGAEDARRLDVTGEAHGLAGRVIRALQWLSSPDFDHVARHAEKLHAGGFVVGVEVGEDEDAKRRAADALRGAGSEFVNYYADHYIESLDDR